MQKKLSQLIYRKLSIAAQLFQKIKAKKWAENSIVFYVGKHREGLSPQSIENGATGSHASVIFLAREWAKTGRQVVIYSSCGEFEGRYDGVDYINYYKFNWFDTFDTLIIWKNPQLLQKSVNAKRIWFDWHDVVFPPEAFTPEILAKYNRIFAKSYFQRGLLPDLPDSKFAVITNASTKSTLDISQDKRKPFKLVYASRYYRGLEAMLTYGWQIIKREIPEAELHVYYGWTHRDDKPERQAWKQKMVNLMAQPGIIEHGRISQNKLIEEKATAAIHYYGCTYEEIDCISVRESAMVGCIPVVTDFAAFREKPYCVKVMGEPELQVTQEAIAYKIIELLNNAGELERLRQQFKEFVKHETWENIALKWLEYQNY
jgi:hypothetical protein